MVDATNNPTALSADAEAPRVEQESRWVGVRRAFRTAPLTAWFGMLVILGYIVVALFAPAIAPHEETEIIGDSFIEPGTLMFTSEGIEDGRAFKKEIREHFDGVIAESGLDPSNMRDIFITSDAPEKVFVRKIVGENDWEITPEQFDEFAGDVRSYLEPRNFTEGTLELGTDQIGRDTMSRMIYAARNTVGIALLTTILSFLLGSFLGMLAAVLGGWTDNILSRIVDVLMSIPQLIFALLLLTILGANVVNMILVIALLDSTRVYRLMRAVGMNIVVMDYVEAAKLRGEGLWWLIRKEILPNALAPLIAEFGLRFCFVFLTIAALSFLGLGIQPPTADWGTMVRDNAQLITFGQPIPLYPAAAIALLTVAVNFVVDWMLHRSSGLKE